MNIEKEYKGIYIQDNNETIKYYEHGAHFSYKALYKRLEQIIKNKLYNNKESYKKLFGNLKKANSQKVIRYKKNKIIKINISRNTKVNHNYIYNNLNNNAKLYKSKSINKFLNFSKSYNEEQFGSFILNKIKNINLKKSKDIFSKKKIKDIGCNQTIINNNIKKSLKNNHTVLKYVIMPKKYINKNENIINSNYYGISPNKIINIDSEINSYGELSYNSTYNNYNNKIKNERIDANKYKKENNSQNKNFSQNSKKYKKIKISSIINKRFIQKLINDSPKNNSSFLSNNNSAYYSQSKTQRTSENNIINFNSCKKQNSTCIKKFNSNNKLDNIKFTNKNLLKNKIIENNYYIENNNGKGLYNNNINKNILLSNHIKQKNKKLTIYNLFNKINFQNNSTNKIKYLNNHKNDLLLEEKERNSLNINSSIKNKKINYNIQTKNDKEITFINNNNYNYNSTSNSKDKNNKKRKLKNNYSQNNFLKLKVKNNINTPNNKNKTIDSLTFYVDEQNRSSKNKKSRNKSKNIVNLLCCHFSINFNSPINLLNNIQNNITANNINNKIPKINTTFGINNINNYNEIKNIEKINNLSKNKQNESKEMDKDKSKLNVIKITKVKSKEIEDKKNIIKKIKKIPINITKEKTTKIKINNISNINYIKGNKSFLKKKIEQNIPESRYNSSKRIIGQKVRNNSGNSSNINNSYSKLFNKTNKNNNNNTYSINNMSTNSNANTNNISNTKNLFHSGGSFCNSRYSRKSKI